MSTKKWIPSACNLCYANCGVLIQLDESGKEIVKVKGDKAHPVSKGYTCNKAAGIKYYQSGRDRLDSPLRRNSDGSFERIDWDTAISEISERFNKLKTEYGGDKIFYYGGGNQGSHLPGTYAAATRNALGIKYRSNAIAQEKTGLFWMNQRVLGGYYHGDFHHCDVALIIGKNPWQSNGMQRARILLKELSKDPARTLVVMDPRKSETAKMADIHLAVKPGTDVWCITAILGHLCQNDMLPLEWLQKNTVGADRILDQLRTIPTLEYAAFAGIEYDLIVKTAEAMAATNKIAVYEDLGIEMSPYSTLCAYLNIMLFVLPGAFDVEGGTHLTVGLASNGKEKRVEQFDDNGYELGRPLSPVTKSRIVADLTPCNLIPEEILTDHPDRFRGMIVENSNPMHSLADTMKFKEAFAALDTLVVIDVAMTETAQVADYVLPASSQYEKAEATFFPSEFPDNFFHLRKPIFEPKAGTLPEAEIHARLIEALGVIEPEELLPLKEAAKLGRHEFGLAMAGILGDKKLMGLMSYVLYRTLGPTLPKGQESAAVLWGLSMQQAISKAEEVKAAGFDGDGLDLANTLFDAILNGHSGIITHRSSVGDESQWRKSHGKLQVLVAEMSDELDTLSEYKLPVRSDEFPLLFAAGERRSNTAMTVIRNPEWHLKTSNNAESLSIHPNDASAFGLVDGEKAKLVTKRGETSVRLHVNDDMQEGTVSLPNGMGLTYPDENGVSKRFGVHVNELTDIEDRDPWVGTPYHKHVRARLERVES